MRRSPAKPRSLQRSRQPIRRPRWFAAAEKKAAIQAAAAEKSRSRSCRRREKALEAARRPRRGVGKESSQEEESAKKEELAKKEALAKAGAKEPVKVAEPRLFSRPRQDRTNRVTTRASRNSEGRFLCAGEAGREVAAQKSLRKTGAHETESVDDAIKRRLRSSDPAKTTPTAVAANNPSSSVPPPPAKNIESLIEPEAPANVTVVPILSPDGPRRRTRRGIAPAVTLSLRARRC